MQIFVKTLTGEYLRKSSEIVVEYHGSVSASVSSFYSIRLRRCCFELSWVDWSGVDLCGKARTSLCSCSCTSLSY
jgi:hypothetical protein